MHVSPTDFQAATPFMPQFDVRHGHHATSINRVRPGLHVAKSAQSRLTVGGVELYPQSDVVPNRHNFTPVLSLSALWFAQR